MVAGEPPEFPQIAVCQVHGGLDQQRAEVTIFASPSRQVRPRHPRSFGHRCCSRSTGDAAWQLSLLWVSHRLATILPWPVAGRDGALIGYGSDYADMYRAMRLGQKLRAREGGRFSSYSGRERKHRCRLRSSEGPLLYSRVDGQGVTLRFKDVCRRFD